MNDWIPSDLDPEADQIREMYAAYGFAMYQAQVLEHGLANYYVAQCIISGKIKSREEIDQAFEKFQSQTMGRQRSIIVELKATDEELNKRLKVVLDIRNELAHSYFRQNVPYLYNTEGRNKLIEQLHRHRENFVQVDEHLDTYTNTLQKQMGITDEMVRTEFEKTFKT